MAADPPGKFVEVEGMRIHYTEHGEGDPVLLLHGWPTSAYLWRKIAPIVGRGRRAIAIDLPGFGHSDKPPAASYSFRFHAHVLDGFLEAVGAPGRIGLAVHDLGGPIGLYWASQNRERVERLAVLNTLAYARPSLAVVAFVASVRIPGVRSYMTSQSGLRFAMRLGVHDRSRLSDETIAAYLAPFTGDDAREALRRAAYGLHPKGFRDIERWLPEVEVPVRIVYGKRDRILPDVRRTMERIAGDVKGPVEVTVLSDCGHFCQEERPTEIGDALSAFFGPAQT